MQDPAKMTFSARAAAKDEQIRSIQTREDNEARLKKELTDEQAARAKDEEYLVQLALSDAVANQMILEKYAHRLPPPAPPAPPPPPAPEQVEVPAAEQPVAEVPVAEVPAADADAAAPAPATDPGVITLS